MPRLGGSMKRSLTMSAPGCGGFPDIAADVVAELPAAAVAAAAADVDANVGEPALHPASMSSEQQTDNALGRRLKFFTLPKAEAEPGGVECCRSLSRSR